MAYQKTEREPVTDAKSSLLIETGLSRTDLTANALSQIVMNPAQPNRAVQIEAQLTPYLISPDCEPGELRRLVEDLSLILLSKQKASGLTLWQQAIQDRDCLSVFLATLYTCRLFYSCPVSMIRCIFHETAQHLINTKNVASLQALCDFIRERCSYEKGYFGKLFSAAHIPTGFLSLEEVSELVTIPGIGDFIRFEAERPCADDLTGPQLLAVITPLLTGKVPNYGLDILHSHTRQLQTSQASTSEHADAVAQLYDEAVRVQLGKCDTVSFVKGLGTAPYSSDFLRALLERIPATGLDVCLDQIMHQENMYNADTLSLRMKRLFQKGACPDKWWTTAPWNDHFLTPNARVVAPARQREWVRVIVSYLLEIPNGSETIAAVHEFYKQAESPWLDLFLSETINTVEAFQRFNLSFADIETTLYDTQLLNNTLSGSVLSFHRSEETRFVKDLLQYRQDRNTNAAERYGFGIFPSSYTKTQKFYAIRKVLIHIYGNEDEKRESGAITAEDVAILEQGNLGRVTGRHHRAFEIVRANSQAFTSPSPLTVTW